MKDKLNDKNVYPFGQSWFEEIPKSFEEEDRLAVHRVIAKMLFKKPGQIHGTGRYAVLFCDYIDPSAGPTYGHVHLFKTLEEADKASMWDGLSFDRAGYCHGCNETHTIRVHPIVDLAKSHRNFLSYVLKSERPSQPPSQLVTTQTQTLPLEPTPAILRRQAEIRSAITLEHLTWVLPCTPRDEKRFDECGALKAGRE